MPTLKHTKDNKMKKIITLVALVATIVFTGCGSNSKYPTIDLKNITDTCTVTAFNEIKPSTECEGEMVSTPVYQEYIGDWAIMDVTGTTAKVKFEFGFTTEQEYQYTDTDTNDTIYKLTSYNNGLYVAYLEGNLTRTSTGFKAYYSFPDSNNVWSTHEIIANCQTVNTSN